MSKLIIQENVPLAPMTTMKIGGPARFFAEVSSEEEILEAVNFAEEKNLEIFVLAGGSNILVSDEGFRGLVIKVKSQKSLPRRQAGKVKIESENPKVLLSNIWAGDSLANLVIFCKDNSLSGLEWAAGIPGTVGGAVRGNAGAYGGEMSESVEAVRVIDLSEISDPAMGAHNAKRKTQNLSLKVKTFKSEDCLFGYRSSVFKKNKKLIILSAKLKLENGDKLEIEKKMKEIISKRSEKLPCDPSAGSFFQNPIVKNKKLIEHFEKDTGCACRGNTLPAGWLIEEVGLRGKKIGNVMVSEKHANFVINLGQGKAEDVIMLASLIKQQVRVKLGVQLKEEIEYVGF